MPETTRPTARHRFRHDTNLQQHFCNNLDYRLYPPYPREIRQSHNTFNSNKCCQPNHTTRDILPSMASAQNKIIIVMIWLVLSCGIYSSQTWQYTWHCNRSHSTTSKIIRCHLNKAHVPNTHRVSHLINLCCIISAIQDVHCWNAYSLLVQIVRTQSKQ